MIIYRASFESRNFTFEAFDSKPDMAQVALVRALHHHATTYPDVDPSWFSEAARDVLDTPPESFALGLGYRDGEPCDARGA